jgi:hypothetical protein
MVPLSGVPISASNMCYSMIYDDKEKKIPRTLRGCLVLLNYYIYSIFKFKINHMFCVLGFLEFTLVPFSLSSSLGAGSGKRAQKPLGVHQGIILILMKENTAVCNLQPNYVSCIENLTQLDIFTSMHRFIIHIVSPFASFHSYHLLAHYFAL